MRPTRYPNTKRYASIALRSAPTSKIPIRFSTADTTQRLMRFRSAKQKHTLDAVPSEVLVDMAMRLYALMNLSWGYVETILNLCIQMRIEPTKILVRKIRELKREYDKFRWKDIDDEFERNETRRAEIFEDIYASDFDRLFNGIEHEVNKLDLNKGHKMLVIAVQQALTLMDAVKIYAKHCDDVIAGYGVWTCDYCMVQTEFLKLYPLIPQFAGDCYQPNLNARKLTANILVNRLINIEIKNDKN